MKKNAYMAPVINIMNVEMANMVCGSIKKIGGNSPLQFGDGDTPESADSRGSHSLWDDED